VLVHLRLQLLLPPLQGELLTLQCNATLPVLLQRHHASLIGIAQALELVVELP
jgi:hypothetical protein